MSLPHLDSVQKLSAVVSELELILQSLPTSPPDPLFCFDLLKSLRLAIDNEPEVIHGIGCCRSEAVDWRTRVLLNSLKMQTKDFFLRNKNSVSVNSSKLSN